MTWKSTLVKPLAAFASAKVRRMALHANDDQVKIMKQLVSKAKKTKFGKLHHFDKIKSYEDFKNQIPISDYESLRSYIDQIINGTADVLWPGKPKYFAKTSGTTSGIKYIPITRDSIPNHMNTATNAILHYVHTTKNYKLFDGKIMFLSGSPILKKIGNIPTGRLSGIVNHEIPSWLKSNQIPSYETNCIEDWETKLDKVINETQTTDLRILGGIPPWIQMYYEKLIAATNKKNVNEIFPYYSLFVYGGVHFAPYKSNLELLIGKSIDTIETYPASEGFIAFQDTQGDESLLLNSNSGIFFEFIPLETYHDPNPLRLTIDQVELYKDYALLINNNAGLWAYNIGDCVRFVSLNPYKILITGRTSHYISAFGEHVIAKEVETAIMKAIAKHQVSLIEFTVAPQVNPPDKQTPYHEWFIEFDKTPTNLSAFKKDLDAEMVLQNIYYKDLIKGGVLRPLQIVELEKGTFKKYMKSKGKLGGQNKVPRLTNNRQIVTDLIGVS